MRRKEILQRLEERLARGEISEKTYLDIKARYEAEPEEPVAEPSAEAGSVGPSVEESVARATSVAQRAAEEAGRTVQEAMQQVTESLGAADFAGVGVRLSEEAIRITGSGTVSGNPVKTQEFKAAGSARVQGGLVADRVRVSGSCSFEGDVKTDQFKSAGSVRVAGGLTADQVDASGSVVVEQDLKADDVAASGSFRVGGTTTCDRFHSAGAVRLEGGLKADEVDIELAGDSLAKSIEADHVEVRERGGFGVFRGRGELTAERIQGDEILLESTVAEFVHGDRVRIGPHCRIGVVEAKDLVVHQSSEVRERRVPGVEGGAESAPHA